MATAAREPLHIQITFLEVRCIKEILPTRVEVEVDTQNGSL